MKPRLWASIVIFVSGYAPLALILCALNMDLSSEDWSDWGPKNPFAVLVALSIALVSSLALGLVMRLVHGDHVVNVVEVEDRSPELLNYTIPYVVSFVASDLLGSANELWAFLIFLALMCAMSVKTQVVFINPLLTLFNYRLYGVQIESEGKSASKLILAKEAPNSGAKLKVCELGPVLMYGEMPFRR